MPEGRCGGMRKSEKFLRIIFYITVLSIRNEGTYHRTSSPCSMKFFRLGRVCLKSGVPSPCWYLSCKRRKIEFKKMLADIRQCFRNMIYWHVFFYFWTLKENECMIPITPTTLLGWCLKVAFLFLAALSVKSEKTKNEELWNRVFQRPV